MKLVAMGVVVVVGAVGCATAQPFVLSDARRAQFDDTVRAAQAGAGEAPHQVTTLLTEAKSEFEYAQHLPKYPDRARAMADKAQRDAEAALRLARSFVPAPPPAVPPAPVSAPTAPPIRVVTAADGLASPTE